MKIIRHHNTLFYYDGPQVFEARDTTGGHYIAVMAGSELPGDRYILAGVTPKRLRLFRSGHIDLRSLLIESDRNERYVATAPSLTCRPGSRTAAGVEQPLQLRKLSTHLEISGFLPDSGFLLPGTSREDNPDLLGVPLDQYYSGDIMSRTIWQHAAGKGYHNHAELCLENNVILHGPGKYGKWPDCMETLLEERYNHYRINDLGRFCEGMKAGDLVVLRHGLRTVYGIAIVGRYEWCEEYNRVEEWDVGHARHVYWTWKTPDVDKPDEVYGLAYGGTTRRVHNSRVRSWIVSKLENTGGLQPGGVSLRRLAT